ncbi:hypothetical protein SAMN05660826_00435 [Caldanaerovirga acetigignens]|uniref:DUF327 domain-containing protein n=2 Tax=Caldanaerovirga acetigignens TaxID=447595 RepID=A0A1M7GRW2_9FIRM|nr:hypothetical protein SAMN05660826_00435 [Caldanaerovirga acetigignens]
MNTLRVRGLTSKGDLSEMNFSPSKLPSAVGGFKDFLKSAQEVYSKEQLSSMLSLIEEQGKRLVKTMSLADLKKYKEMVGRFVKYCLELGLKLKEERLFSGQGKQKVLTTVKIVDGKLIELTELLFSKNVDVFKVLSLVDEIRGLLLDLYA